MRNMPIGSIVRYTPREGEDGYPALVLREWPDGQVELYAFHFEAAHHVRAAHTTQIEPLPSDQELNRTTLSAYLGRIADLEALTEAMLERINSLEDMVGRKADSESDADVDSTRAAENHSGGRRKR